MKIFAAAKASLVFVKNRCKSSRSQMIFKMGVFKKFAILTGKHLCWSLFLIKLQAFRFFPVNIAKLIRPKFFIKYLRWLLHHMFCFTLYFQKDNAEYIAVLHCIIVSFWNLKSLSFAFIRCTTRCRSLYHSLSLTVTSCHSLSLVVTRFTTRCPSLYYSLSFIVPLVVISCHLLYHLLSLDVHSSVIW